MGTVCPLSGSEIEISQIFSPRGVDNLAVKKVKIFGISKIVRLFQQPYFLNLHWC